MSNIFSFIARKFCGRMNTKRFNEIVITIGYKLKGQILSYKYMSNIFSFIARKFCGRINTKSLNEIVITKEESHTSIEQLNMEYYITKNNDEMQTKNIGLTTLFSISSFVTDYVFPVVFILIDDQQYNVQLQSKSHTYYIVGNKLNKDFVATYLNMDYDDVKNYTINLVDNFLKSVTLTEDETLVFEKTMYKII